MSMAALPAETVPFGCRILCDSRFPGPASHDGIGRRFVLIPPDASPFHHALDVEMRAHPAPEALTQALGPHAMARWGEIEVIAKLLDQPAHLTLRRALAQGAAVLIRDHGLQIARCDTVTFWRVIGRRPAQ